MIWGSKRGEDKHAGAAEERIRMDGGQSGVCGKEAWAGLGKVRFCATKPCRVPGMAVGSLESYRSYRFADFWGCKRGFACMEGVADVSTCHSVGISFAISNWSGV